VEEILVQEPLFHHRIGAWFEIASVRIDGFVQGQTQINYRGAMNAFTRVTTRRRLVSGNRFYGLRALLSNMSMDRSTGNLVYHPTCHHCMRVAALK
jgi:hypothetical protein